jgi:hypothetical protein
MHERPHINRKGLALMSLAIALVCGIVLVTQVRDRWNSPEVKTRGATYHDRSGRAPGRRADLAIGAEAGSRTRSCRTEAGAACASGLTP